MKRLLNKIINLKYENDLVLQLAESMTMSMIMIFIAILSFFVILCYDYIPHHILLAWYLVQLSTIAIRIFLSHFVTVLLHKDKTQQLKLYLNMYTINVVIMGFTWSYLLHATLLYAPQAYSFIVIATLIAITSTAVITLGAIIHIYMIFLYTLVFSSIFTLLLQNESIFTYSAIALIIYLMTLTSGALQHYRVTRDSVLLKIKLNNLNRSLKDEVYDSLKELEYKHYHDNNTKLPNRQKLLELLDTDDTKESSILLIDIRKFKNINDTFGHKNGDILLQKVAEFLQNFLHESDTLYKLSGNEFVIHSTQHDINYIQDLAQKIQKSLQLSLFTLTEDELELIVEVVISIVVEKENILEKANLALNYAKEHKQKILTYSQALQLESICDNDIKWSKIIKNSIENDLIVAVYQPIVDIYGNTKYETLMRLRHDNQLITPFYFLDIAKKTHYYLEMTKIMIDKSFQFFENRSEMFSINLSYEDIQSEDLISYLLEKIDRHNIAYQLIIEIIESEKIDDYKRLHKVLAQLRNQGVKLAIDDFGSGYSNFSYILELEPDLIKIDGSLIQDIDKNMKSFLTVQAIVHFAHTLGIDIVCEYIHSQEVFNKVKELEVEFYQGYYFSKPLEAEQIKTP